uniref:Uncharacterized protein n=1 Tax=Anguilla anguilla TaxID=7936 RepID=A0A0E9PJN8_ANGAN
MTILLVSLNLKTLPSKHIPF